MASPLTHAQTGPVRYREGSSRGLLALRTLDGVLLGSGELRQTVKGAELTSRLTFRFKDGSFDQETAVYSQHADFHLIRDHHVQRGPSFPHPIDMTVDVPSGMVTVRSGKPGEEKVETQHMDLPSDVANGFVLPLMKNLRPGAAETKLSMVAAGEKPRLIKLAIYPDGEESFLYAGERHRAQRYLIKVQLGGLAGVVAPLIGKAPEDVHVWLMEEGAPPMVMKTEGQLYADGPVWRIELAEPVWPLAARTDASARK